MATANRAGNKGDTIYMSTDFDVDNVFDRSAVIHELTHAAEDKASVRLTRPTVLSLETNAYRAQARFLLEQIHSMGVDNMPTPKMNEPLVAALFVEAKANRARYEAIIIAIAGAETPPVAAATVSAFLGKPATDLEAVLTTAINTGYRLSAGQTGALSGLAGESWVNVLRLIYSGP